MTSGTAFTAPQVLDREAELRSVLFRPMGADGVYGRTLTHEVIFDRLSALITGYREDDTETLRFPPVMSRSDLERHGYLKSFPNLISCACVLHGNEAEVRAAADQPNSGWTSSLKPTDLVLSPAACYPIYPIVAARGSVPPAGIQFDVAADCFRREPSSDLDRLQSFRMREYVQIGSLEQISSFRQRWIDKAQLIAEQLQLPHRFEQASDPFFGRTGQIMAATQLQMALKVELLVPFISDEKPTACMSFNNHKDHFGEVWDIRLQNGASAHSGCVAFGMDRLTLALFWVHGIDVAQWPSGVKVALAID